MRSLVWFRSDLRISDNTALWHACRHGDEGVIGLFVISPGEWSAHDLAPCRVDLMLRSLRALSVSLAKLNVPLLLVTAALPGDVPEVVGRVAAQYGCRAVFFNKEYEVNESRRDARVRLLLERDGCRVHA